MTFCVFYHTRGLHFSVQTLTVTVWLVVAVPVSTVIVSMTIMTVSVSSVTVSVCMFVLVVMSPMTVAVIETAIKQRVAVTVT